MLRYPRRPPHWGSSWFEKISERPVNLPWANSSPIPCPVAVFWGELSQFLHPATMHNTRRFGTRILAFGFICGCRIYGWVQLDVASWLKYDWLFYPYYLYAFSKVGLGKGPRLKQSKMHLTDFLGLDTPGESGILEGGLLPAVQNILGGRRTVPHCSFEGTLRNSS